VTGEKKLSDIDMNNLKELRFPTKVLKNCWER